MSYRIEFIGIAEHELEDAVDWYAEQQPDNSASFVLALDTLIQYILEHPMMFPIVHNDLRKASLKYFPYNIIYEVHNPDLILVLAVAHQSRNPTRWLDR